MPQKWGLQFQENYLRIAFYKTQFGTMPLLYYKLGICFGRNLGIQIFFFISSLTRKCLTESKFQLAGIVHCVRVIPKKTKVFRFQLLSEKIKPSFDAVYFGSRKNNIVRWFVCLLMFLLLDVSRSTWDICRRIKIHATTFRGNNKKSHNDKVLELFLWRKKWK